MLKVLRSAVRHSLLLLLLSASCHAPDNSTAPTGSNVASTTTTGRPDSTTVENRLSNPPTHTEQISQYIRRIFQDKAGNMWFATTSDGVARYDGRSLDYFTPANGFASNWVSAMAEDARGDIWFATGGGVSRYDVSTSLSAGGTRFTNYTTKNGLVSDQVWCMLLDKNGGWWFGTEEGVSRFDGRTFTSFPIPAADLSKFPYYKYPKQINAMIEDKAGNIWFGTNGGGAYKYDGHTLSNLSEKDGLCNNFVQAMMEDRAGNIWFGTRYGGSCRYDPSASPRAGGKAFTAYTRKELKGDDVWTLYQDSRGTIWVAMARIGLCSYNGSSFTCYGERDGEGIRVVQSIFEDASGQLWFGTSNGVYKFDGARFINWTKKEALGG